MPLSAGSRRGPYEVVGAIGSGGPPAFAQMDAVCELRPALVIEELKRLAP